MDGDDQETLDPQRDAELEELRRVRPMEPGILIDHLLQLAGDNRMGTARSHMYDWLMERLDGNVIYQLHHLNEQTATPQNLLQMQELVREAKHLPEELLKSLRWFLGIPFSQPVGKSLLPLLEKP